VLGAGLYSLYSFLRRPVEPPVPPEDMGAWAFGDGWEEGLFLPAIRVEEAIPGSLDNRSPVHPLDLLIDLQRHRQTHDPAIDRGVGQDRSAGTARPQ